MVLGNRQLKIKQNKKVLFLLQYLSSTMIQQQYLLLIKMSCQEDSCRYTLVVLGIICVVLLAGILYWCYSKRIWICKDIFGEISDEEERISGDNFGLSNLINEEHNQGLPNVGNTCYLNSILQILYAAQEMRESVISRSKANPSLPFHKLIANVFEDVAGKAKEETKRKHLRALLSFLSENSPQIAQFEQNDAYECLLAILNLLQGQDPRHSKLAFFKVSYEARCDCSGESSYFEEYFLTLGQRCVACKQPFRTDIVDSGRYLIALPQQSFDLRIDFGSKGKSGVSYDVRAFVIYFGNKQSGHYISKRKESGDWLQINDSRVQKLGAKCSSKTVPKLALYQQKEQKKDGSF